MSNILPPEALARIRSSLWVKFILATGLVLSGAAVAGIISLMPAFFLVYFPHVAPAEGPASSTENETQRRADQDTAMRIRTLLTEVTVITDKKVSPVEMIAEAYALKPAGVTVGGATYTKGTPNTITLVGVAKTRDDVGAFRDVLAKDARFEKVSVPVAALVGALEGNFTITISGQF
ncbi:MAG: hypothetical protein G01um10148_143 [Parcubacteria group bacterium Gr01-1014_8]|nr:MAG: hypothetical protein G01um10148_143 [Parcubacteria group bacterium Gr01-1014_8]